jgi:hypothetical protein
MRLCREANRLTIVLLLASSLPGPTALTRYRGFPCEPQYGAT